MHEKICLSMKEILRQFKKSFTVVRNYIQKAESYCVRNNHGRKKLTTSRTYRQIMRKISSSLLSSSQIKAQINLGVTHCTVLKITHRLFIFSCNILKNRPLKAPHIRARLEWANQAIKNRVDWNTLTFSDANKFNLDGSGGFAYYWDDLRKEKRHLSKRHSGWRSLMVWTAFSSSRKTKSCIVDQRMGLEWFALNNIYQGLYWKSLRAICHKGFH